MATLEFAYTGNARVPGWIVRVPKEIIWEHRGLWSDNSIAMLAALLRIQALGIAMDLGKTRWLMLEQGTSSVSVPLLAALIFWLTVLFCSFGLLAPRNATVVATLCVSALSVSAAIFLVLELYSPFEG